MRLTHAAAHSVTVCGKQRMSPYESNTAAIVNTAGACVRGVYTGGERGVQRTCTSRGRNGVSLQIDTRSDL